MKLKSLLNKCQNTSLPIQLYTLTGNDNIKFIKTYSFLDLLKEHEYIYRKVKSFAFVTDLTLGQIYLSIYMEESDV